MWTRLFTRDSLGFLVCFSMPISAQQAQSDNGDGTFTNPVIYSDFPDPDVIRVDSVYYMVSTTMFIFPGVTILKSHDLVNWEYCSNAVPRMDFSPCYDLDGCNRYSHGQWATSLKYKDGKYYLLFITLDEGGFLCTATKPEGPWQIKKLPKGFYDPGLFFDDYGKIYVAHGYNKIPVTWQDDWPMVGVNGKGVVRYKKPNVGKEYPVKILPTSDEFDSIKLGMQWGWNHNPDSTKWSLTRNPGHLRLATAKVVSNLREARNTLTQRIFAYYAKTMATTATSKINSDYMQDGDVAGLAVFQDPYAFIGIKRLNGRQYVVMVNNGKSIDSSAVNSSTVYLRAYVSYATSKASFAYSLDNLAFTKLGDELAMRFNLSIFTGNKFCLFNYATTTPGGFDDFDWFRVNTPAPTEASR